MTERSAELMRVLLDAAIAQNRGDITREQYETITRRLELRHRQPARAQYARTLGTARHRAHGGRDNRSLARCAHPHNAPMTSPTSPASNAPTAPRTFGWLATRVQRWLGISDQRHDFDALAMTLSLKDQMVDGQRRDMDRLAGHLQGTAEQLNRTTHGAASTDDRLSFYEARVALLIRAKRTYDAWIAREIKRRERIVAAHPELSDEGKAYVRATGKLPETNGAAKPAVAPDA